MKICNVGTTLLNYPGKVAYAIFLGGCNFRCRFCHNTPLVVDVDEQPELSVDDVLAYLEKRRGIYEGVCITGGEPTVNEPRELVELFGKIRDLGYPIKLDTNGSHPEIVKMLYDQGLVQYVALDIKASWNMYTTVIGVSSDYTEAVKETASFLLAGSLEYEFRTTVCNRLHTEGTFEQIAEDLAGAKLYFLQPYVESDGVLSPGWFSTPSRTMLERYAQILRRTMPDVRLRGVDW